MRTDFAIYDMDRTVTRHATYTPFLLHCAMRRAPWRLVLLPFVGAAMLTYVLKLIDRAKAEMSVDSSAVDLTRGPLISQFSFTIGLLARRLRV